MDGRSYTSGVISPKGDTNVSIDLAVAWSMPAVTFTLLNPEEFNWNITIGYGRRKISILPNMTSARSYRGRDGRISIEYHPYMNAKSFLLKYAGRSPPKLVQHTLTRIFLYLIVPFVNFGIFPLGHPLITSRPYKPEILLGQL